ncbi:LysR family transcriptional regulator [Methylobacterium sp. C25]|uniref:LysR family transcriptional regulator n=1 Tax=Methylobacterium sp. C25 TaxID=2721622 RepID=UPI003FA392D9|nr:LysR family transcriptional regulator [Methylobacterium sp. C25]
MTLHQLRVFVAVAEREHLTRAALVLHTAPSAVSATIAALEAEYGLSLFDRSGRGLRLTRQGDVMLQEARAVLDRAAVARARLAALRAEALGGEHPR